MVNAHLVTKYVEIELSIDHRFAAGDARRHGHQAPGYDGDGEYCALPAATGARAACALDRHASFLQGAVCSRAP
jgi:hypothetical protein